MTNAELLLRAFEHYPAVEANEILDRARAAYVEVKGAAVAYEVVLDPADPRPNAALLRRLVWHLDAKKIPPDDCDTLFVGAFHGDALYLFEGPAFVSALLEDAGFVAGTLAERVASWRTRERQGHGPLLALPSPDDD